jgi:hypothetical protein
VPAPAVACKVTTQYRSGQRLVYELENEGRVLDVHISSGSGDSVGTWLVAAHNGRGTDSTVIAESGTTRTEALGKVGDSWAAKAGELGLPLVDWSAVAKALLAVRAI